MQKRVREVRDRLVNRQLRRLDQVRRALRRGEVDVLLLGDSSCLFGSPRDTDLRLIPELLGQRLDARVVQFSGAGYSARMHAEVLRLLATLDERPAAVVTSICVRTGTSTHVMRHPLFAYDHSLRLMGRLPGARHHLRSFGRGWVPTPPDYAAWRALPVRTRWTGDSTIGAFRSALEGLGPRPWSREKEALLFDYFHGELLGADDPSLDQWRELGGRVASYGVPTVSYLTAPPVERGERHYPGEFEPLVLEKRALLLGALRETAGAHYPVVDGGLVDEDFADSQDATEHFSFSGRTKLVEGVATALGH